MNKKDTLQINGAHVRKGDVLRVIYNICMTQIHNAESAERAVEFSAFSAGACTMLINTLCGGDFITLEDVNNFTVKVNSEEESV